MMWQCLDVVYFSKPSTSNLLARAYACGSLYESTEGKAGVDTNDYICS